MLKNIMESIGMMGYQEENLVADTPTPAATSAAYVRALEGATAITKANITQFHLQQKEVPHSSICVKRGGSANQLEVIEATLPHQQNYHVTELEETRDQTIQYNYERSMTEMKRDSSPQFIPSKSYKLSTGHTVHDIPVQKVTKNDTEICCEDIEAKNLLQSILHLDAEVTEAAAVVYHYFETKVVDDQVSPGGRALQVIHSIKDELRKGNSKPAYQFLETAKTVLPILREEREKAGLELEANIFSKDSEDSVIPKDMYCQNDDMRSISEQTAAIFQFLDDATSYGTSEKGRLPEDPIGSKMPTAGEANGNIFRILEENEGNLSEFPYERKLVQRQTTLPEITGDTKNLENLSSFNSPEVNDMDLEFVENFDLAYSEFLFYHPKLVTKNPELMNNLRIYKLQKLLEFNDIVERTNSGKLNAMIEEKRVIEESMQLKLKDAVRKKAARQTHLQSEVNNINWDTKQIQAKLRWKIFKYSQDRTKRQSKLRAQFNQIPKGRTRQDLMKLIPEGPHSKKLETALKASFIAEGSSLPDELSPKQEELLRKLQVENSVMNSEISMMNQKLAHLQNESKKMEWVQSTLMELDPATVHKLKKKFEAKEGVTV